MKTKLFAYLCLLFSSAIAFAQSTPGNHPPPNPQIAHLGDYIAFTKDYKYAPAKPLPATSTTQDANLAAFFATVARIQRLEVVKTDDIRFETRSYTDGSVEQVYLQGSYTCTITSTAPNRILVTAPWMLVGGKPKAPTPDLGDFPELNWVTAATFQGVNELQGRKIFTYEMGDQEAQIDAKTQLPLYAKLPAFEVWYTYPPPPTAKLVLPDKIAKKIQNIGRAWSGGPN